MRHFVPVNGQAGAGEIRGTSEAQAAAFREFAEFFAPAGGFHHAANAFREIHGAEAEKIGGDGVRRLRDAQTQVGGIDLELLGDLVELYFLAEAWLHGAVAALRSTRWLVGEGAAALKAIAR